MNLEAKLYTKEEWLSIGEDIHHNVFGSQTFLNHYKSYDFAVLVRCEGNLFCYSTVKEMDSETVDMNFGGVFSDYKGKNLGAEGLKAICDCLLKTYKRIVFTCRTSNKAMLMLGLKNGFEIFELRKIYGFPHAGLILERGN